MKMQSRTAAFAAVLLLAASSGLAQDTTRVQDTAPVQATSFRRKPWPDRSKVWPQHWYKDWIWWTGEFVIAGLQVADAHSTITARSQCPTCSESNLFLGKHPSKGAIVAVSGVGFGVASGLHILMWKGCPDPNRRSHAWRITCNATLPSIGAAVKIPSIIRNYGLASPSPTTSTHSAGIILERIGASQSNGQILLLPKQYGGCGRSLTICVSPQPVAPHVDLMSPHREGYAL